MKRIIYTRPEDGGLSIVIPAISMEEVWKCIPADAINPVEVDTAIIPSDRAFRNAWEHGVDKVQVNMEKAKAIHLNSIRAARNAKLSALDIETMKAVGKGDAAAMSEVEAAKQMLRDIPQKVDLTKAATPDELKAIWPKELL